MSPKKTVTGKTLFKNVMSEKKNMYVTGGNFDHFSPQNTMIAFLDVITHVLHIMQLYGIVS